ncbi:MAG: hypothetical protein R2827_16790, partial [Bdellovibrionales bacterium]
MYLVGTIFNDAHNGGIALTAQACEEKNVGGNTSLYARRFSAAGTVYQNEVRPGLKPLTYTVTVEPDYVLSRVDLIPHYYSGPTVTLTPSSVSGNTYTYDLTAFNNTYNIAVTNTYNFSVAVYVYPKCVTPASSEYAIKTNLDYIDWYYHYKDLATQPTVTANKQLTVSYNTATRPQITLSNLSGSIQAAQPTESAVVQMASIGTSTAPYTWIAIPTVPGVTITDIYDIANSTPLTVIPYAGGVWAQISTTGLASSATADYRVDFSYTNCTQTTFDVIGGWDCSGFPTDPTTYPCGIDSTTVTFIPQIAELEIVSVSQPTAPFNLCDNVFYQLDVNNKQAGNVILNQFAIDFPNGMTPQIATVEIEYPKNSGVWE